MNNQNNFNQLRERLNHLFQCLASVKGGVLTISNAEVALWPVGLRTALVEAKLIRRDIFRHEVTCPGCEESCIRPILRTGSGKKMGGPFVVCDKREDINRVQLADTDLIGWSLDVFKLKDFVACSLRVPLSKQATTSDGLIPVATIHGKKQDRLVHLHFNNTVELVAGGDRMDLIDFVEFREKNLIVNLKMISKWIDSLPAGDTRHVPQSTRRLSRKEALATRNRLIRNRFVSLQREHPDWPSDRICKKLASEHFPLNPIDKTGKLSAETIRKIVRS